MADQIAGELKARGFVVHRTDAVNSTSAYLKVDYGVMNTVRISDHKGAGEKLDFRFNILSPIQEPYRTRMSDGTPRYWYGFSDLGQFYRDIEAFRQHKLTILGEQEYKFLMSKNAYFAEHKPWGMWKKARRV
jgi:hypothetical protein